MWYCNILYQIIYCSIILLYGMILYDTELCYIISYYLYCMIFHYIVFSHIMWYYIILYQIIFCSVILLYGMILLDIMSCYVMLSYND